METLVIAVAIVLLIGLAVVLLMRKFSSPETTAQTLLGVYRTFQTRGVSEGERLFQMFATRGGWRSLPEPFLRELAKRLVNKEDLIKFVILAERYGLLESNFARIAASPGPEPESVSFAVDQVAITLRGLGKDRAQRAILGPGFAMFRGEWRPLGKWAAKLNYLFYLAETAFSYREPQDAELALQLALGISSTRSMNSSPRVVENADKKQRERDRPARSRQRPPEVVGAPDKKRERREDPATRAFYLAARASGTDLAGMPPEVRRLTPEQAGEMLRQVREAQDAKTVDRNSLTPAGRAALNAGKCPDCGGLLDSFASGTGLACKWCGTVYPN